MILEIHEHTLFQLNSGRVSCFAIYFIYYVVSSQAAEISESQREKTYLLTLYPKKTEIACASAQSDQSIRSPHEETLHPWLAKCAQERF